MALQALQAEWKTIGAVTRGHEKAVWESFAARAIGFFTRRQQDLKHRKESRAANLARKGELCAKAEALADSTDWDSAAAQIRQLQAEWKTVGPVRKAKSEVVWQRSVPRAIGSSNGSSTATRLSWFPRRSRANPSSGSWSSFCRRTGRRPPHRPTACLPSFSRRARWQQAPELPRQMQQDLAVRFHEALGRLVAAWPAAFSGTDLDPDVTRRRMEKLVTRVEELASASGNHSARLTPAELLARQWRERLASNTAAGGRSETDESRWRAAEQDVRNAQAQWTRLGPVPADVAGPLNERFQRACRRFFERGSGRTNDGYGLRSG